MCVFFFGGGCYLFGVWFGFGGFNSFFSFWFLLSFICCRFFWGGVVLFLVFLQCNTDLVSIFRY